MSGMSRILHILLYRDGPYREVLYREDCDPSLRSE